MACGVIGDDLIAHVGAAQHTAALAQPGAQAIGFSGKPMAGWVTVAPAGYAAAEDLACLGEAGGGVHEASRSHQEDRFLRDASCLGAFVVKSVLLLQEFGW